MQPLDLCENAGTVMCRDAGGLLYVRSGDVWHLYDFNAAYAGFYPACRFTALTAGGGLFHAAGLDEAGVPRLFSSISGGVWEERPLAAQNPLGSWTRVAGCVIKAFWADSLRQLLLVTDAGEVVTLPDCPKCLRIRTVGGRPADARLRKDALEIDLDGGAKVRLSLSALAQYRVSWSYAAELLRGGAALVDLRSPEEYARGHLQSSVNVPFDRLADWLEGQDTGTVLLFLCRLGVLADEAADYARAGGWTNAYSMGGLNAFAHVE